MVILFSKVLYQLNNTYQPILRIVISLVVLGFVLLENEEIRSEVEIRRLEEEKFDEGQRLYQ